MADPLPTWHGKPLYVCPHCGTSRFTQDALGRHLSARHVVDPAASVFQAAVVQGALSEPAPPLDTATLPIEENVS